MDFDPRITPARPDLAARHLQGKVNAARYADGVVSDVIHGQTPVRRTPAHDGALDTEALKGERVTVYDTDEDGWCWGQLASDGYVGWLPQNALMAPRAAATHRVAVLRTLVFPAPDIKVPPVDALPMGSTITVMRMDARFAVTESGFIPLSHVVPLDQHAADHVAIADKFLGVPYLWGGKTSLGIDCSGLVQIVLTACGITCPRDSDMQEQALGAPFDAAEFLAAPRHGDLIFWNGHVAIMRGDRTIIHANAHHMAVEIEPLDEALTRIAASGSDVTSVRRLRYSE